MDPRPDAPVRRLKTQTWAQFLSQRNGAGTAAQAPYDVVIVGSGYGGSVAAHTLATAAEAAGRTLRLLLLERGKAFHTGDFPSTFAELPRELRVAQQASGEVKGHEGLFDLRLGPDVAALVANGVGGGSLINAGVMLVPEPADVQENGRAPLLAPRLRQLITQGIYTRTKRLLGAEVQRGARWVHNSADRLPAGQVRKLDAFRHVAQSRGARADAVDITVSLDGQPNQAGTPMAACNGCGDCMTGCNVGAKDSLDRNLLLGAQARQGVTLDVVTGAAVVSLSRKLRDQRLHWVLKVAHTDPRLQQREASAFRLSAARVILAAGTLGSTEILLRSRSERLVLSPALGESFSGNGDDIAALHRLNQPVHSAADEDLASERRRVGPTTTARMQLASEERPFLVEEFSVPGPMRRLFDEVVTTGHTIAAMPRVDCSVHTEADFDPAAVDPDAMARTLLVGVIGHDSAGGSLRLARPSVAYGEIAQEGSLCIHWPDARWGRELDAAHAALRRFAELPGQPTPVLVANPMWRLLPEGMEGLVDQPRGPVLTVHPLGGCRMGVAAREGVVDACGRVYDARGNAADDPWFGSLLVLDGSIVGASLGVNPALTIAALTLGAMEDLLTHDPNWQSLGPAAPPAVGDPSVPATQVPAPPWPVPPGPDPQPPRRTEVAIIERMVSEAITLPGHEPVILELTLAFAPAALAAMVGPQRLPLDVLSAESRVRLYNAREWQRKHLKHVDDAQRAHSVRFEAELCGQLRFLHRGASHPLQRTLHALWAWLRNRGIRELYQRFLEPWVSREARDRRAAARAARPASARTADGPLRELCEFVALANHAGQTRWFEYQLKIGQVLVDKDHMARLVATHAEVHGLKRLRYERRSSPWTQLTRMRLAAFPGLPRRTKRDLDDCPELTLDARFLARQGWPLLRVSAQRNHAEALAELLSLGLYMLRVLIDVHLWSFRKPDEPPPREPNRLPPPLPGMPPTQITTLTVGTWPRDSGREGEPVTIRLTRYPLAGRRTGGKPLVMIHGYSASGTTFAHPSLEPSAARFFWEQERDVWVLDLRTSCGLASAGYPWAMEQAALIDIPSALLHVRNATGQRVDVLAHCIGASMLSMALLCDPRSVRHGVQQLGTDTWLDQTQLGTLAAFNGPGGGTQHPTVDHVVLSQKGPVMHYTDANVLRAHVLQYVRRFLLPPQYRFQPSREPGVAEQLLDRLLSSLPYDSDDFDRENPLRPCAKTPWVATRHRVDALFGRTFSAATLRDETLDAIGDFFGPLNLDTVAQTIHFAQWGLITNQRGRGEFLTSGALRERWGGIPTLALHGLDNGLVHPHTLEQARQAFGAAGIPLQTHESPTGHQDSLIGTGARAVFEHIEGFLRQGAPPPAAATAQAALTADACWIGPRLVMPAAGKPARVAVMTRPDQGRGRLWLVPVQMDAMTGDLILLTSPEHWIEGDEGPSGDWLFACPDPRSLDTANDAVRCGWLCLVLYLPRELAFGRPGPVPPDADVEAAARTWMHRHSTAQMRELYVSAADLRRCATLSTATGLRFALGSCQYPGGLFDRAVAGASLQRLADAGDEVSLALMVGDQIYADATAGLLDPTRRDERYELPHQRALRVAQLRRVMQRMPVQMLLDDHELFDNWEPLPVALRKDERDLRMQRQRQAIRRARRHGVAAYLHYQRMEAKSGADCCFEAGGHAFYLLDTRSRRQRGQPSDPLPSGWIVDDEQRCLLESWLLLHRDQVKFIASPSLLLPRRVQTAAGAAEACRSDAWDGFPDSMRWLLGFIDQRELRQIVFLSGDEHHALHAQAWVGKQRLKIVSVHASAFYAPYPFANGRPRDLLAAEWTDEYGVPLEVRSEEVPTGDGFAVLDVLQHHGSPHLRIEYGKAGDAGAVSYMVSLT